MFQFHKKKPPKPITLESLVERLKGLLMDTSQLNEAVAGLAPVFGQFNADFTKFTADFATFVQNNVPQDTPQQKADVAAAVIALQNFKSQVANIDVQVQALDAAVNAPAAPPPPPPPPPPAPGA